LASTNFANLPIQICQPPSWRSRRSTDGDDYIRQFTRLRNTVDGFKLLFESAQPVLEIG